jgi:hypothetical protein
MENKPETKGERPTILAFPDAEWVERAEFRRVGNRLEIRVVIKQGPVVYPTYPAA